jgi:hypothetical protein
MITFFALYPTTLHPFKSSLIPPFFTKADKYKSKTYPLPWLLWKGGNNFYLSIPETGELC